jgi:hypothetical protein
MKRFVLLDTTPIPENGGALCLFEYGEDFVIKIQGGDGGQLMNTRMHGSEDALAEIPCRKVAGRPNSRVLIGGLGMGFTSPRRSSIWARPPKWWSQNWCPAWSNGIAGRLGEKSGNPLLDPRTVIRLEDVAKVLQAEPQGFDAIMLDVDNGPEGLTRRPTAGCTPPAAWRLRQGPAAQGRAGGVVGQRGPAIFRQAEKGRFQGRGSAGLRPWQQGHPAHHLDCREAQGLS